MAGPRGDVFESPGDTGPVLDSGDVRGLVEAKERTSPGSEFAACRPLVGCVRADRDPSADGKRVERRRRESMPATCRDDSIVDDVHPRDRRADQVDADGCSHRCGKLAGRVEHVDESFPSFTWADLRRIERRWKLGRRMSDADGRPARQPVAAAPGSDRADRTSAAVDPRLRPRPGSDRRRVRAVLARSSRNPVHGVGECRSYHRVRRVAPAPRAVSSAPFAGRRASWSTPNTGRHSHRSTCALVRRLPPTNGSGSMPEVVIGTRTGYPCSPARTAQPRPSSDGTSLHVSAPAAGPTIP